MIFAGGLRARNYAANYADYRADSHFLYLVGAHLPDAALVLSKKGATLYATEPTEDDELWHGPSPSLDALGHAVGCAARPLTELAAALARARGIATLPCVDTASAARQSELLARTIRYGVIEGADAVLADAIIALRLAHDEAAVREMEAAAASTADAHATGMRVTRAGIREHVVASAMTAVLSARGHGTAYAPIVSVHGEVLHNHAHDGLIHDGELLLCDVGAETAGGWAGDVTRTWPVSGRFSPTQRAVYDIVLAANTRVISLVRPGARWRDLHLEASRVIAEGLVELGWLRGSPVALVEEGAHALFFPHGLGHLIGLDVHDMEDLGDRAGYAPGRTRSTQFGLSYLRLDRDLTPGMGVTVEPGIYVVPAILGSPRFADLVRRTVDRDALARFADVRGIRIEDDVVVTDTGARVLTDSIPKRASEVEAAVGPA